MSRTPGLGLVPSRVLIALIRRPCQRVVRKSRDVPRGGTSQEVAEDWVAVHGSPEVPRGRSGCPPGNGS